MKHRYLCIAVTILLLAAGLRFHRLAAQSFWNDEGNSARLSERSIPLILEGTASDIHPPLYYLILRGWRELAGDSEFSLRAPSVFSGVLLVAVTVALARQMGGERRTTNDERQTTNDDGRRTADGGRTHLQLTIANSQLTILLASFLTAINPALIYYSQEARMYQLLALLATLSTLLLWRWQRHWQLAICNWQLAIAYVLCVAAGLYTHYFFPAVLLAHGLIVLLRRQGLIAWVGLMGVALLLYLPWLPIFLDKAGGGGGRELVWTNLGTFLLASGRWLVVGAMLTDTAVRWLMGAVIVLLLAAFSPVLKRHWPEWNALVWLLPATAVPLAFMFAAGLVRPAFFKFLVVAVPPFCLLLAFGAAALWSWPRFTRFTAVLLLAVVVWGSGRALLNLYDNPAYARADYRAIAARIEADNHRNAGVILNAPNQWEVFTYYHRQGAPVYPIPRSQPDPETVDRELSAIAATHGRLYAVFWGEAERDPQRLVEGWLDSHAFKATDEWVGDVRFVTYAVPDAPASAMATATAVAFGDHITLAGYTLAAAKLRPGDIIQVTLFWQTAVPLAKRYKVFLHLLDEQGRLVAQRDSEPGGGLALTTTWEPGRLVPDNHGVLLPPALANGRYTLLLGLYDLADPEARLPVASAAGGNALILAQITVRP
jgi:mannosyltransferase